MFLHLYRIVRLCFAAFMFLRVSFFRCLCFIVFILLCIYVFYYSHITAARMSPVAASKEGNSCKYIYLYIYACRTFLFCRQTPAAGRGRAVVASLCPYQAGVRSHKTLSGHLLSALNADKHRVYIFIFSYIRQTWAPRASHSWSSARRPQDGHSGFALQIYTYFRKRANG